jgi:hypothetical protein
LHFAAAGAHGFEHFAHLGVLFEEVVDVADLDAGAFGDALAALAVDEVGVQALLHGHGVDDGFDAGELLFVHLGGRLLHAREGADRREHLEDGLHAAELLDLAELLAEVFEREAVAGEGFFGEGLGGFFVELFFGAFEERGDVAHAEDAADDAVGVEGLEGVGLFAGAEELDGLAGDVADGEGGAAAGVAVHLGEDGAGDLEAVVEGLGGVDGVLAGHGVGDEEDLGGVELLFELGHFVHERFVDAEAAGGVDDEDVVGVVAGFAEGFFGEAEDAGGVVVGGGVVLAFVALGIGGGGDDFELLAGGGAVDVVLPEPCSPAMRMTVGGCEANLKRAVSRPRMFMSSSETILMICSEGLSAVATWAPRALARMSSMMVRVTSRLTSDSRRATRISRRASLMLSSVRVPWPRRDLKERWSFSERASNMAGSVY